MSLLFLLLLGGIVFVLWNHFHWQAESWPEGALEVPRYQSHRGYHAMEQENTLAAFRAAKTLGARMVELDTRLSKEKIPVVFHDANLSRLSGESFLVSELSVAELRHKAAVATLEEVLSDDLVPAFVNIEIKSKAAFNGELEKAVAQVIRRTRSEKRVLISSFNPMSIRRCAGLLPEVPRALLATREEDKENKIYLRRMWLAPYIHAHLLHLDERFLSFAQLRDYRRRGIPVACWTVNDEARREEWLRAGALSVISDLPPPANS